MDAVSRRVPDPRTFGPARELYELAGPADPTFDELAPRLQRAYSAAARYLRWEHEQDGTPGVLRTPLRPESAVQAFEAHVVAVMAVLKRSEMVTWEGGVDPTDDGFRGLAEACVAAADVGF